MDVLVVVDMQEGLLLGDPKHDLAAVVDRINNLAERVLIAGWATDFCVDATVRSAAALGFRVVVVSDGHTLAERPHLSAEQVIEHHQWIWTNLISAHPVTLMRAAEL